MTPRKFDDAISTQPFVLKDSNKQYDSCLQIIEEHDKTKEIQEKDNQKHNFDYFCKMFEFVLKKRMFYAFESINLRYKIKALECDDTQNYLSISQNKSFLNQSLSGNKMKGMILITLNIRHKKRPIRKYFLRWWLRANPEFVRQSLIKIPAYCCLNEQIVYWRFRKLLEKPKDVKVISNFQKRNLVFNGLLITSTIVDKVKKNYLFHSFSKLFSKRIHPWSIQLVD